MNANRILTLLATLLALTAVPGLALADFSFTFDTPVIEAEVEVGIIGQFHTTLTNTGSQDDTYHLQMFDSVPADWTTTICEDETCFPPFIYEIDFSVSAGNSTTLDFDITPGSPGIGSVMVIITNQNNTGTSLQQEFTVYTPGMNSFDFDFSVPALGQINEVGIISAFHTSLTNTGSEADTYTGSFVKDAPELWTATVCEGETCFPPFITEIEVPLGVDSMTNLDFDLTAGDIGQGSMTVTITSQGNPAKTVTHTFTAITPGLDVLVVDADGGADYETYYEDALAAAGKTFGTWQRDAMGSLTNTEMALFPVIVWETGNNQGALDGNDFGGLTYMIQHGGGLFLSGQNLAYQSCDPESPYYSSSAQSWFNGILGADYAGPVVSPLSAAGPANDIVTGDLDFNLYGGDGAGNNETPDSLFGLSSSSVNTLVYDTGSYAAVRSTFGSGRSFLCGFAFEGIDTAANRNALMSQVLAWFAGELTPAGDVVAPLIASVPYASPNPFNPQTSIKFEVGGTDEVTAQVVIYNLKGQVVRNLFQGSISPGPRSLVWDGRSDDGRNLATGVYMAQVQLNDQTKSVKMTLVK